jgi:hypothetical protein
MSPLCDAEDRFAQLGMDGSLPAWANVVADAVDKTGKKRLPIVIAGNYGQGKVFCFTPELLRRSFAGINPQDGPLYPELCRLWQAAGHFLTSGMELPIDNAMRSLDTRLDAMRENRLGGGIFDGTQIEGFPAYWMARGFYPERKWKKLGEGLEFAKVNGENSLCLNLMEAEDLTSMTFPIESDKEYVFSGKLCAYNTKGTPQGSIQTALCLFYREAADLYAINSISFKAEASCDWSEFRFSIKPFCAGEKKPYAAWIGVQPRRNDSCEAGATLCLSDFKVKQV